MKKILFYCSMVLFIFIFVTKADAALVDFINPFSGIDDNTSSWSHDNNTVTLGQSISILNGIGSVHSYKYDKILQSWLPTNTSQRGTRGLGVNPSYRNERDEINKYEMIIVYFQVPCYLNSFEVRSLFKNDSGWGGLEEGEMYGYLNGTKVLQEHMQGQQDYGSTNGIVSYDYGNPYLVDSLSFTVLSGNSYSSDSEFALAKFDVEVIPEPVSLLLFGIGTLGFGLIRKRKK